MLPKKITIVICVFFLYMGITGFSFGQKGQQIKQGEPLTSAVGNVVNLEQGWTTNTQEAFYYTDQGSRLMPYEWFLALEQASGEELFRAQEHIDQLRYLPTKPTKLNPDALPVGFTKNVDDNGQAWMGFNCALCHTAQISYEGTDMRIDGGPTIGDVQTLQLSLVEALKSTYTNQEKFVRFADRVLGNKATEDDLQQLHAELVDQTNTIDEYNQINYSSYPNPPHYGFARVDAIGSIFNQIMVKFNDVPGNARISDAPVSYPFIWGTNESDVIQWPAFTPNGPASLGTLLRNGGEVLGVFGNVDIPEKKSAKTYKSSLNIKNLGKIEKWVDELRSPQWPEEFLPKIDTALATKGELHFQQNCAQCHQVIKREEEGIPYNAVLTPVSDVKTDPTEVQNMARKLKSGKYEGRLGALPKLEKIPAETTGLNPLVNAVLGSLLDHPLETIEAANIEFSGTVEAAKSSDQNLLDKAKGLSKLDDVFKDFDDLLAVLQLDSLANSKVAVENAVYKARPLNGIWATAPYLHNGSVPNLYELLLPADQRSSTFYVGNREFDPAKVGYVSSSESGDITPFEFDTSLKGNSNEGHEYGVNELSDDQKLELLEYLKTL